MTEYMTGQGWKCDANYRPLTPLSPFARAAEVFSDHEAVVYGDTRLTWAELKSRCARLALSLCELGVVRGDIVSTLLPNVPTAVETHFAIPMAGGVLNAINTRIDAETIAFILEHAETKVLIVDSQFIEVAERALELVGGKRPLLVECPDEVAGWRPSGRHPLYSTLVENKGELEHWVFPKDEWESIALNYTSGTTGRPKGVLYHHRGAYLSAMGGAVSWDIGLRPRYLSIVPQFHCNAWCHIWLMPIVGGTVVCCRDITAKAIFDALADENVSHFGCAPIVLNMMIQAKEEDTRTFNQPVSVFTAGAPPAPSTIAGAEALGLKVRQVYGLTETYGHVSEALEQPEWQDLDEAGRYDNMARIGVRFPMMDRIDVVDPETHEPVAWDGETTGEIVIQGNAVMKGYLKNDPATLDAFKGGMFWSGDIGVRYPDGYVRITDRSKDIIISGGENISSVEVEGVLMAHPAVSLCSVVAKPDDKWGEVPCAFIERADGCTVSPEELIQFSRDHLAGYKCPKDIRFMELPKTSTGKIQKFELRSLLIGTPDLASEAAKGR